MGRSQGGLTSKIHALVDADGRPVALRLTGGHDKPSPYANTAAISTYREQAQLKVPGLADLRRMAMLLLADEAPEDAHMIVVGAGGGMETLALAKAQPGWRFTGVDPSAAMLDLARDTLAPVNDRVALFEGIVDQAFDGLFDGATCILTLHHVEGDERLRTLREIHRRLKTEARLVVAGHTAPGPDPERWMARSVAFSDRSCINWEESAATTREMTDRLPLLLPLDEEAMLSDAGYSDIALFYAALSFRGWVATAGPG